MTDIPAELRMLLDKQDDHNLRFHLSEMIYGLLMEETEDEPDTVDVMVTFAVTREDWNRYRASNLAHMEMNRHEAIVEMIQDCLYDGGPLEFGEFKVV